MTLFYPDVSNNNWRTSSDAIGFLARLAGEGFAAVAHKVSEGDYYRDPYWPTVRDWCTANETLLIGYHYVTGNDPATQARLYRDHVGDPSIPCMLDFEADSGDLANFWAVVQAFNAVGIEIALSYIPHWYWVQIGRPELTGVPGLVASSYPGGNGAASALYEWGGGSHGAGWAAYGGAQPAVWQFTDRATIAGIRVDANAFRGTPDDFTNLLGVSAGETMSDQQLTPEQDTQLQLRGPGLDGWPQLGGHTVVDALAVIGQKLGIRGFAPPAEEL